MQPKHQDTPNQKKAPGHPGANQSKPDEEFPGKAPDVYGDERHQKPGHTPGQNPKRDQDHNPDGDPRHGNPDDQRRDQRQNPQHRDERAHRPGQDRE